MTLLRRGLAEAAKLGPTQPTSMLTYATLAFESQGRYSSTHSVDPTRPYSSPSQLAKTIVRSGFQPNLRASPKLRMTSLSAAEPLLGSPAPPAIQASRWLPTTMTSSGRLPLMIPITFQRGVVTYSCSFTRLRTKLSGDGPTLYLTPLYSRPRFLVQYLLLKFLALGPWPLSAFKMGMAST